MSRSDHLRQQQAQIVNSYVLIITATFLITAVKTYKTYLRQNKTLQAELKSVPTSTDKDGSYESLVGNTPLICLRKLSSILGQGKKIYVKMESLNPGGTGKDRAALSMIRHAQETQELPPERSGKGVVVEGTSGSTGISLASLCASKGYKCIIFMPDDQANEKRHILECLGAKVNIVPNCAISNPNHYVNLARRKADEINKVDPKTAAFMNQFENIANFNTHYHHTGPEIWRQMHEIQNNEMKYDGTRKGVVDLDAFVMSSGTGGTLAGVGTFLKEQNSGLKVVLVDPPGSSLYNKVKYGVAFAPEQKEQSLRRHRYDTIAEGVGLDRVTNNFAQGVDKNVVNDAIRVSDQEMVDMAHWLLQEEGLFVGSSSAMNVVGAVRTAIDMPPESKIVTVICDGGQRHLTRFWNRDFITSKGLIWPQDAAKEIGKCIIPDCIASLSQK